MENQKTNPQNNSRRDFLIKSAKLSAGVAIATTASGLINPETVFAKVKPKAEFKYTFKSPSEGSVTKLLDYPGLDPEKGAARAYQAYFDQGG